MPIWRYRCVICEQDIREWIAQATRDKKGVCPKCSRQAVEDLLMSDPLCKPCKDEGREVLAAYKSHPPMCASHYAQVAHPSSAIAQHTSVLNSLTELRLERRLEVQNRAAQLTPTSSDVVGDDVEKHDTRKRGKKMLDDKTIQAIRDLSADGLSGKEICEKLSVSYPSVKKYGGNNVSNGHAPAAKKKGPKGLARANGGKLPSGMGGLLDKWNEEANAVFAALSLEHKAKLLETLESR